MVRFQGTDGVRRKVRLSNDPSLSGLTPQQAFLDHDVITEQFMELYTYCRVRQLVESGAMAEGENIVIGWDPRDPSGVYTSAAVRGLLKGGANALVIGVAPTPAIAVYARAIRAAGGVVITASHNPASYNGIKIFTRRGLKLLPGDDIELSRRVNDTPYSKVQSASETGHAEDKHAEAIGVFIKFSLDPRNSWITEPEKLHGCALIVDTANGALSPVAEKVLSESVFGEVISLNSSLDGSVNVRSGVAELEGVHEITPDMVEKGGRFFNNETVKTVFARGRELREKVVSGEKIVSAAVFDGDGDRFYRVDYDPFTDSLFVLTGDETAVLQAGLIKDKSAGRYFVNTVESDLNAAGAARELGYKADLTAVGDKWILFSAALSAIKPAVTEEAWAEIEKTAESKTPSADAVEKILEREKADFAPPSEISFAIGSEESGHNISPAVVETPDGLRTVFAGNGLKSCLNTFAATAELNASADERLKFLRHPFPAGFKKTLYVYYVDKSLWERGSDVWDEVKGVIFKRVENIFSGAKVEEMIRPEDADMLYVKITQDGEHFASVFARNSGTEDKIGISLRGPLDKKKSLFEIGEEAVRGLLLRMKDMTKPFAKAETALIETCADKGAPDVPVGGLGADEYELLLVESGLKQGLLDSAAPGARLTKLGEWYHASLKEKTR